MFHFQKDFFNLIKKIGLSSKVCDLVYDSWEVKDIDFQPKTKNVKIQLKQLTILPFELITQLVEKCNDSKFKVQFVWKHQIDWEKDLANVRTYVLAFFKNYSLTVNSAFVFTSKELEIVFVSPNDLQVKIAPALFAKLIKKEQMAKDLKTFLNNYGIFTNNVYVISGSRTNSESVSVPNFFTANEKEIKSIVKDFKRNFIEGKVLSVENRMFGNKQTFNFVLESKKLTKKFVLSKETINFEPERNTDLLKKGKWLRVYFKDDNSYPYLVTKLKEISPIFLRNDLVKEKRVELHVHTKMSALDGIGELSEYLEYANHWKHKAIAITDHQNVHIFPECDQLAKKYPEIKIIFGCEFEFLDELPYVITGNLKGLISSKKLLFFDIETTGLSSYFDEIIEFAGVLVKNGIVLGQKSFLIKSKKKVPEEIYQFTNISEQEHQASAIPFKEAMKTIKDFFADNVVIAHNSSFDINFLNAAFVKAGFSKITNPVIDTLNLSRFLSPELRSHRLQRLARKYKISSSTLNFHRAVYDSFILRKVFEKIIYFEKINRFEQLYIMNGDKKICKRLFHQHLIVLVKNKKGLQDLYRLVSHTHTKTLFGKPILLKKDLEKHRDNLLVGSSCYNGVVFDAACSKDDDVLTKAVAFCDYIEIQPLEVYQHLITRKKISEINLKKAIFRIINTAKALKKIIVATGDVHYLEPEHFLYRDVFVFNKQLGGKWHDLYDFQGLLKRTPPQYFRTTDEMLKAFAFLNDSQLAFEMVVTNTHLVANQIEKISCFKDDFIMPRFNNAEQDLEQLLNKKVKQKYGNKLDPRLQKRLYWELKQIIDAGYSTIYLVSYYLTDYSTKEKHFFGSRGSVGSSFVAFCLDITEVNPLSPHYLCSKCYYLEWIDDKKYLSGFDLPKKKCPKCPCFLSKDGHEISFESFLGIDSENIPDIDLNFSGNFQPQAQKFVVDLFTKKIGKGRIFWTGTVLTVAKKLAYGYYKSYAEKYEIVNKDYYSEDKIVAYCSGVKKTTGQHPGGLMIIPKEKDILDFSPYNYPSNNWESGNLTTHFDYHVLHNHLLKIDVLGHDDPTGLKMLYEMTSSNPKSIDLSDKSIIDLFASRKVLGLPEFGTNFVVRLLREVKVSSFADLIVISGLSHGKNVWESNARDLIKDPKHTLSSVISSRDDILFFLLKNKVERKFAYQIMQKVKKGVLLSNAEEKKLQDSKIPQWYIDSCKKIKYLFPKAHAVAYVIMSCRFAWFKINYPHEFYAVYLTMHCTTLDLTVVLSDAASISKKIKSINSYHSKNITVSNKDRLLIPIYEVVLEMYKNKIQIVNLDLNLSTVNDFIVKKINGVKVIIPPFSIVDRLGVEFAKKIVLQREKKKFSSQQDFKIRTGINQTAFENLQKLGLFKNLNENVQNTFKF